MRIVQGFPSTMGDDYPLNTTTLIRHAARTHPSQEIVYRTGDVWARYSYAECFERIGRAAAALRALGVGPGDRVGVIDWNDRRFFELYYAIPGIGAVMVLLNQRLRADDLGFVVRHSQATLIAVDETLLPLAEEIAATVPVGGWIVMSDRPRAELRTTLAPVHHYEEALAVSTPVTDWPMIDERAAYAACYTTGTTGQPKGVYYSHRAIYLHAMAIAAHLGITLDDCSMFIAPMFHAQSWGLPQAATLMANKIVLPGRYTVDDVSWMVDALIEEGVTVTNGAPAILMPMLRYLESLPVAPDLRRLRLLCGASEPPLSMMRGFQELTGAEIVHAYGATETTPLVTINRLKPQLKASMSADESWSFRSKQGLPVAGVDVKILGPDDRALPHDGRSVGEICFRGPWVIVGYHELPDSAGRFADGYWRSGDVGTIDAHGYLKVTDRIKDVIKSGGEWISSIDMENALMGHAAVREAAVVGVAHPQWQERPLALVVLKAGQEATPVQLKAHLGKFFAKWQLPDEVLFLDAIPKTSVGKIDKKAIRSTYGRHYDAGNPHEAGNPR
jgi:fatty-acyl-CoA synthase